MLTGSCSYITQAQRLRDGAAHHGLRPQTYCHSRQSLIDMATSQPDRGNSSNELLPPQIP